MSHNIFVYEGNVGKIEEMKSGNNYQLINFSIPINKSHKVNSEQVSNEWKTETGWIKCVARDYLADYINTNLTTGCKIWLEGKFEPNNYIKDGKEINSLIIKVTNIKLLEKKAAKPSKPVKMTVRESNPFDDDIPF